MTETLKGIWREGTGYLADVRHPIIRAEWDRWQAERGYRPDTPPTLRDRRQFDREMLWRYGDQMPPPARTKWQLMAYDIMDAQEELANRPPRVVISEREVFVDEPI